MRISIQARQFSLTRALRRHTEQRVRNGLARFDERIMKVSLWLSDVNGRKGGSDKNCQVQIVIPGAADVVVEETQANLYAAINRAIERAGLAVVRKLDRQRTRIKRPIPMFASLPESA